MLRAELHPRHVAQPQRGAVAPRGQDDRPERRRVRQAPGRRHPRGPGAAPVRRRVDRAGGELPVLRADRVRHVRRPQPELRQLVRVQPHPHRVVLLPEELRLSHARHPLQFVDHLPLRVGAEEQVVVAARRRAERDDAQQRARRLGHLHPRALRLRRQGAGHGLHPVADVDRRLVRVGADVEARGQRQAAVADVGLQEQQVVHAVDRPLQRQRHRLRHARRVRPRIRRRHLHLRRHDLRILRDRQRADRDQAGERDHQRQHRRQHRTVDEGPGVQHGRPEGRQGWALPRPARGEASPGPALLK